MKKCLILIAVLLTFTACKNREIRSYNSGEYYRSNGKAYDAYTGKLITGYTKKIGNQNGEVVIGTYEKGSLVNIKALENGMDLMAELNVRDGLAHGLTKVTEDEYETTKMYFNNGMMDGPFIIEDYDKVYKGTFVKGVFHGLLLVKRGLSEEKVYFNFGVEVDSADKVEELETLDYANAIELMEPTIKENLYFDQDGMKLNGLYRLGKGVTYAYFEDGKMKWQEHYDREREFGVEFYLLLESFEYTDKGTRIMTVYHRNQKDAIIEEDLESGEVISLEEFKTKRYF